jgi:hypothetical protein
MVGTAGANKNATVAKGIIWRTFALRTQCGRYRFGDARQRFAFGLLVCVGPSVSSFIFARRIASAGTAKPAA